MREAPTSTIVSDLFAKCADCMKWVRPLVDAEQELEPHTLNYCVYGNYQTNRGIWHTEIIETLRSERRK